MDLAVELAMALQQQGRAGGGDDGEDNEEGEGGGDGGDGEGGERIHMVSIRSPEGLPAEVRAAYDRPRLFVRLIELC